MASIAQYPIPLVENADAMADLVLAFAPGSSVVVVEH